MLDLETLGKSNNALIIAIGAVIFDPADSTYPMTSFYTKVDPEDAQRYGLTIDASTVLWWLGRSKAAQEYLTKEKGTPLVEALNWFRDFCGDIPVWGNASVFDNVILKNAYRAIEMDPPWNHRNDRCYRTLAAICPMVQMERVGVYHNAVDDARSQAVHLQQIFKRLGLNTQSISKGNS